MVELTEQQNFKKKIKSKTTKVKSYLFFYTFAISPPQSVSKTEESLNELIFLRLLLFFNIFLETQRRSERRTRCSSAGLSQ